MALLHHAYAFAYAAFSAELAPLLSAALATGDGAELASFIDRHLDSLSDPYEGEPLAEGWRDSLESGTPQELGELALTKYYDGDLDMGLDSDWLDIKDELASAGAGPELLLGTRFGPASQRFDPSGNGSYFQSEAEVAHALEVVRGLTASRPELAEPLAPLLGLLGQAARRRQGLYVTF